MTNIQPPLVHFFQRSSQTVSTTSAPCSHFFFFNVAIRVCTHPAHSKKWLRPSQRRVGWRLAGRVLCRADCAVHFTSQVGWKTQGTGPWACTKSPHLGATSTGLSAPLSSRFCSSSLRQAQPSTDPACHDTPGWFFFQSQHIHVVIPPISNSISPLTCAI